MPRFLLTIVTLAGLSSAALAQDRFSHGSIRYVDPGVTIQRGAEAGAEEAYTNLPFLPGDRVWTSTSGRVEFQFEDGSLLRLDTRSKLDYVSSGEGRDERIVLHLWSGGAFLHGSGHSTFEIETPGGLAEIQDQGVYRIDVDSGETRLSVYDGEATLASARGRVRVSSGERTYGRGNERPETPQGFDRREADDFTRWDGTREDEVMRAGNSLRYLPEDVSPYASDLDRYGSWYYEGEVGYVWRPLVGATWRPYCDGRWIWTSYGWTWVPAESWGWVPFHYGRWGYSNLGWYWIPGRSWGPAWVSWAVGTTHVGWAPLGYRDRPIVIGSFQGNAVARGSFLAPVGASPWIYARREDLGSRNFARRRPDVSPADVGQLHIADSPRMHLTRDLRLAEGAIPRNVRVKATPGDTVPELRPDPSHGPTPPAGLWNRPIPRGGVVDRPTSEQSRSAGSAVSHPTDTRAAGREAAPPSVGAVERQGSGHEVLKRFFDPLSERPRSRPRQDGENANRGTSSVKGETPPRSQPREDSNRPQSQETVRSQPSSQPRQEAAPRSQPHESHTRGESPHTESSRGSSHSGDHASHREKQR